MMTFLDGRPLLRFALGVIALLPTFFLAWYFLGAVVASPAILVAQPVLEAWLPELVASLELRGTDLLVFSNFGESNGTIMAASAAGNQLAYLIDTRVLSYSVPFFCALFFATPRDESWGELAWSLMALWALMALGLISTALKNLMLGLGERFFAAAGAPPAEVVALSYQFSTLIVPPLAPVILWAYTSRNSVAFRSLLPSALSAAQASDRAS